MITFITSIRHPNNSIFYERVWDLLEATLYSVCSQTNGDFRVIVVCNEILDDFLITTSYEVGLTLLK